MYNEGSNWIKTRRKTGKKGLRVKDVSTEQHTIIAISANNTTLDQKSLMS
jgi:hypothetical protein